MLLDEIMEKKNEILSIFEKHGSTDVILIGSVSRGEEREDSDIDFVANFPDLIAHAQLVKELKCYFGREIHLACHQQIKLQFAFELSKGIQLNR